MKILMSWLLKNQVVHGHAVAGSIIARDASITCVNYSIIIIIIIKH